MSDSGSHLVNPFDLPSDYEECGDCGHDHAYDPQQAAQWHKDNPCSYCPYTNNQHTDNCPAREER